MRISLFTDDSPEGEQLKQQLIQRKLDEKLRYNYQIRWGNWIADERNGLRLNTREAIKNTVNKEDVLLLLRKNHVNCPKRIKPGKKSDFPIIGRKYEHNHGTDIRIIDNLDECKKCNCDYFIEYLKITEECRVHVMDTEVFYTEEKYETKKISPEKYTSRVPSKGLKLREKTLLDTDEFLTVERQQEEEERTAKGDLVIRTKAYGWRYRRITLDHKSQTEREIIINLARKAVYAVGLDFGVVTIGKTAANKYYVLDVDCTCREMSESCLDAYTKELEKILMKYDSLLNSKKEVTIGADPEFILKDKETSSLVYASDFFERDGDCGYDDRSIEAGKLFFPLVEIRPLYSVNPREVVQSIRNILQKANTHFHYKNIGLYAGCMPAEDYWVGGHIHFGMKPNIKLLKALDNYMALPVTMIEDTYSSRRRKIKYGALGNFREKDHGGFEYCTLGSWLVEPKVTTAVLCLAKVVAEEYQNLQEEFLCSYADMRAFYAVNKTYFRDKVPRIIKNIQETETYKEYEQEIQYLFQMLQESKAWNEKQDIKDTWGLKSTEEIYKPYQRSYIPKKKRIEYGIQVNDIITVSIGGKSYNVKVYPKDDFSYDKESYVSFSTDICKDAGITEEEGLNLWFDRKERIFKAGPIFGIFTYTVEHIYGPFGLQSYYFRKLIKFSKDKGMIPYVFTIRDIDWHKRRVKGYTYNFHEENWERQYFPLPEVIYDRGDIITQEYYGTYASDYIKYTKRYNIRFINSLDCIQLTNDKWATCKLLSGDGRTERYQIETSEYKNDQELLAYAEQYGHIFLKLKNGSRSKGIISIEKINSSKYEMVFKNSLGDNEKVHVSATSLLGTISEELRRSGFCREDYIVQKAISLAHYNHRKFEIRVVMQKNSKGTWVRTCMIARSVGEQEKFISISDEQDIKSSVVLVASFGEEAETISEEIRKASRAVVDVLDDCHVEAGEIAIDVGIDVNGNIYIIELNSKPDNLLATIGAFKMRNLAMYRLLEYAKFLAFHRDERILKDRIDF